MEYVQPPPLVTSGSSSSHKRPSVIRESCFIEGRYTSVIRTLTPIYVLMMLPATRIAAAVLTTHS